MQISVLMPAYNAERFIGQAIESVLSQTHQDFEFIIIDDGSKDRTAEISRRYAQQDTRIRFYQQENAGLAVSLNRGMELAGSEWLARIDADDLMMPNRLERQIAFVTNHPNLAVAGTFVQMINANNQIIGRGCLPYTTSETLHQDIAKNQIIRLFHPSVLMAKSKIIQVGGYRPVLRYSQDVDLWNRVVDAGFEILVQPEYLTQYRVGGEYISVQKEKLLAEFSRYIAACVTARRNGQTEPTLDEFRDTVNARPFWCRWNCCRMDWSYIARSRAQRARANRGLGRLILNTSLLFLLSPGSAFMSAVRKFS